MGNINNYGSLINNQTINDNGAAGLDKGKKDAVLDVLNLMSNMVENDNSIKENQEEIFKEISDLKNEFGKNKFSIEKIERSLSVLGSIASISGFISMIKSVI